MTGIGGFQEEGIGPGFCERDDIYMSRQIRTAPFCSPQQGAACRLQQMQRVTVASGRQSGMVFADRENIKPRPDAAGVLALNAKLEEALKSYEVSFTLLPMVAKPAAKATPTTPQPSTTRPYHSPPTKGGKKGQNRFFLWKG